MIELHAVQLVLRTIDDRTFREGGTSGGGAKKKKGGGNHATSHQNASRCFLAIGDALSKLQREQPFHWRPRIYSFHQRKNEQKRSKFHHDTNPKCQLPCIIGRNGDRNHKNAKKNRKNEGDRRHKDTKYFPYTLRDLGPGAWSRISWSPGQNHPDCLEIASMNQCRDSMRGYHQSPSSTLASIVLSN